jgi:hypothetical protein
MTLEKGAASSYLKLVEVSRSVTEKPNTKSPWYFIKDNIKNMAI